MLFLWPLAFAVLDRYPESGGHAMLVTQRHADTWFEATAEQRRTLADAVVEVRQAVAASSGGAPEGWTVGFHALEAAGHAVPHLRVPLTPTWRNGVPDLQGGTQAGIPERMKYAGLKDGA